MTDRHPIDADVDPNPHEDPEAAAGDERDPARGGTGHATAAVEADAFKEALRRWASTVTLVAVRDEARIYATTVSSFAPVSAEPPEVVVSLGPNAQVLPFLQEDARFVVNLLASDQASVASRYADAYPVGASPFPTSGNPVADGAVTSLVCRVRNVHATEAEARLVVGRVEDVVEGTGKAPLLWYERGPRRVAEP